MAYRRGARPETIIDIDTEHPEELPKSRPRSPNTGVLGSLSANRKRKLGVHDGAKFPKSENAYAKEISRATAELARLVGSPSFRGRAGD